MNIEDIKNRINAKLYGEEFTRGVMEFSWAGSNTDEGEFESKLKSAKSDCLKFGIKWIDVDQMSNRIVVVTPKEHAKEVSNIMNRYGFECVNQIFDPKPNDAMRGQTYS